MDTKVRDYVQRARWSHTVIYWYYVIYRYYRTMGVKQTSTKNLDFMHQFFRVCPWLFCWIRPQILGSKPNPPEWGNFHFTVICAVVRIEFFKSFRLIFFEAYFINLSIFRNWRDRLSHFRRLFRFHIWTTWWRSIYNNIWNNRWSDHNSNCDNWIYWSIHGYERSVHLTDCL